MNHSQIIEKLNKLKFVQKDTNKLISEEGLIFSWSFEFTSFTTKIMPIQLVVTISHNNGIIVNWGCESNEDTFDFVTFINKTLSNVSEYKYDLRDENAKIGKELFNRL